MVQKIIVGPVALPSSHLFTYRDSEVQLIRYTVAKMLTARADGVLAGRSNATRNATRVQVQKFKSSSIQPSVSTNTQIDTTNKETQLISISRNNRDNHGQGTDTTSFLRPSVTTKAHSAVTARHRHIQTHTLHAFSQHNL